MMRSLGPVVLGCCLIAFAIFGVSHYLTGKNPWEEKIARAKSILYYKATEKKPLNLIIYPSDSTIRILSHIILSTGAAYDPYKRYSYGLRVSVPDKVLNTEWTHDYWIQTRQSKSDPLNDMWLNECAFTTSGLEVSDDRITYIKLPEGVPSDEALLKVELIGWKEGPVLIRAYRDQQRTPLEIAKMEFSLGDEEKIQLADRLGKGKWSDLTPLERELMLLSKWDRVMPAGVSGADYGTLQIYFTGFHLPVEFTPAEAGELVPPGKAIALALDRPAKVELYAKIAPEPLPFNDPDRDLRTIPSGRKINAAVEAISISSIKETSTVVWKNEIADMRYDFLGGISLAKGRMTGLVFTNRSDSHLYLLPVLKKGDPSLLKADAETLPLPDYLGDGVAIRPDKRHTECSAVLPGAEDNPLHMLFTPPRSGGEAARIIAYPRLGSDEVDPVSFTMKFSIEDKEGKQVWSGEAIGQAKQSIFEGYPDLDPEMKRFPGEAQVTYLRFPAGKYFLRLDSDRHLDVIVQTPICLYCEDEPEPGYPEPEETLRWRNERPLRSRWIALEPENYDYLLKNGRSAIVSTQPRLEAREEIRTDPNQLFEVLEPRERGKSSQLMEQAGPDSEFGDEWKYSDYVMIKPGGMYSVSAPPDFMGRPAILRFDLGDPEKLEDGFELLVDKKAPTEIRPRTVIGEIRERIAAGRHTLELSGPSEASGYWINLPAEDMKLSDRYGLRTVHKLEKGERLTFSVEQKAGMKRTVNILVYRDANSRSRIALSGTIDRGRPRVRGFAVSSGVTQARKRLILKPGAPSRSILETERGVVVGHAQLFFMTFFEEAGGGLHELSLSTEGGNEDIWLRAFVGTQKMKPGHGFLVWKSTRR